MFVSGAGSLNAAWSSAAKAWCCDACTACGASPAIGWIRIASGLAMKTPLRKRVEADAVTRSLPVPSDGLEEAVRPAEPEIAQQLEGMRAVDFVVLDRRVWRRVVGRRVRDGRSDGRGSGFAQEHQRVGRHAVGRVEAVSRAPPR